MRDRSDCLQHGFDVWMGGYPRSANTFAAAAFKLANPDASLASHFHIPAFIIHNLRSRTPGVFLIRRPEASIVSWTLYWEGRMKLEDSLDYYVDFHRSLRPYLARLFVVPFEQTTQRFGEVIRDFNSRFGTGYASLPPNATTRARCNTYVEDFIRSGDGSVNEFRVSRPSAKRDGLKPTLLAALRKSPRLSRKLKTAEAFYTLYTGTSKTAVNARENALNAPECWP